MIKTLLLFGFLSLPMVSCTTVQSLWVDGVDIGSQAGLVPEHRLGRTGHWVLPHNTSFYVARGELPQPEAIHTAAMAPGAGSEEVSSADPLGRLLVQEIAEHFPRVLQGELQESMHAALQSARQQQIDYVLYPRLLYWEDRAGTWTEVANSLRYREPAAAADAFGLDRARLQLTLLESRSGRIMDVVAIDTRGGALTAYQENPGALLGAAVGRYVDSLVP